jgi:hypothetical protein
MSEFRYYCLHDDGRIALGEHVEATDLDAAINHAYENCRSHPTHAYRYVEVWRGSERLYSSPRDQEAGSLLPIHRPLPTREPIIPRRGAAPAMTAWEPVERPWSGTDERGVTVITPRVLPQP